MESSVEDLLKYLEKEYHHTYQLPNLNTTVLEPGMGTRTHAYQKRFNEQMKKIKEKNHLIKRKTELLKYCRKHLGILSLTSDPLNEVMWSHYADIYKGVCIGFSTEKLVQAIVEKGEVLGHFDELFALQKVYYTNYTPKGLEDVVEDFLINAFTTKTVRWKYEEEYRLLRTIINPEKPVHILEMLIDTVVELYLGYNFTAPIKIPMPHGVKIFKVSPASNKYKLIADQIDAKDLMVV